MKSVSPQSTTEYILTANGTSGITAAKKVTVYVNSKVSCGDKVNDSYGLIYNSVAGPDGRCWLDRNLGATQVATSATDSNAYGSLFQWGRGADGHELINWISGTKGITVNGSTVTQSTTDTPSNNLFIESYDDWRSPKNDNLWQGVDGINNVCPSGYRLPKTDEWSTLIKKIDNAKAAFQSTLKLTVAGNRESKHSWFNFQGGYGNYWAMDPGYMASFSANDASIGTNNEGVLRASGQSVRCIRDETIPPTNPLVAFPSTCVIPKGSSTCTTDLTLNIIDPVLESLTTITKNGDNTSIATGILPLIKQNIIVDYPSTTFYLNHNGGVINSGGTTVTAVCEKNTKWDGGKCLSKKAPVLCDDGAFDWGDEVGCLPKEVYPCGYPVTDSRGLSYGVVLAEDGKCWLDRNLGATQVATSATDYKSYGSLFQWGRPADGHQLINWTSAKQGTVVNKIIGNDGISHTDVPTNNRFIIGVDKDWRSPKNDNLWQGVNGINNVCPSGFHVPTKLEWGTLIYDSAHITNSATAYRSKLKLPVAGLFRPWVDRGYINSSVESSGDHGFYWSSGPGNTHSYHMYLSKNDASAVGEALARTDGYSVRCIQD
jgi:uncharacterized protein (TIGR02145 family)